MTIGKICLLVALVGFSLTGCGTTIPQVSEAWEGQDINGQMAFYIKQHIFCELVDAIDYINERDPNRKPLLIPDDYGVQLQTTITIDENTAINPGITLNRTFPNATPNKVTFGQSFNLGLGATASTDATRIDTAYTYWRVKTISHHHNDEACKADAERTGSSPLLRSNLGIKEYLFGAVSQADFLHSSTIGKAKTPKLDIYSYEIKFIVITNGNVNPTWKLVNISSSNTLPLITTGRTRTHDLILTFGPNAEKGLEPSYLAAEIHRNNGLRAIFPGP